MARAPMPPRGEFATVLRGRDLTRGWVDGQWWQPPRDSVLREQGRSDHLLYEDLMRDDRVWTAMLQRRAGVLARETQVLPGGEMRRDRMAADQLREVLEALPWDSVVDQMLYASLYGWAVAECMWMPDGRHVVPARILPRDRRRFVWRAEEAPRGEMRWRLLLRTTDNAVGEAAPDRKFWTVSMGADHADDPYGRGLGHALYWPVWFKRNQVEFWLVALEKWGQPTGLGKHSPTASEADIANLKAAAASLHADSSIVIPDTVQLELLEASRSGSVDYGAFHAAMNRAISEVILTETMTTEDGSSRSQAEVHLEVKSDVIEMDTWMIHDSLRRTVATWLRDWNFPGAAVPIVKRIQEDEPNLKQQAERDKLISEFSGRRLTPEYVEETYGVELGEETAPAMLPGAGGPGADADEDGDAAAAMAAWAERPLVSRRRARSVTQRRLPRTNATQLDLAEELRPDVVEQVMAAIDAEAWDEIASPMIEPILRRAREDPEALLSDLASVWPEMDVTELAERLARILFVGSVWGRLETQQEDR